MNRWNLVALAQARTMPWKNGGGITHELAAGPDAQDWRWRMSVAQVAEGGPFSSFPGVHRWFAVLSGRGVLLNVDGQMQRLTDKSPVFAFDGAVAVDCALIDGATLDFNLMVRGCAALMQRVRGDMRGRVGEGRLVAVYAIAPAVVELGGHSMEIPADTLAWKVMDAEASMMLRSDSALWIEVGSEVT